MVWLVVLVSIHPVLSIVAKLFVAHSGYLFEAGVSRLLSKFLRACEVVVEDYLPSSGRLHR